MIFFFFSGKVRKFACFFFSGCFYFYGDILLLHFSEVSVEFRMDIYCFSQIMVNKILA